MSARSCGRPRSVAVWLVVLAGLSAIGGCRAPAKTSVQEALQATLLRFQHAVSSHDANTTCQLLVSAPSHDGPIGSLSKRQHRLLDAVDRECAHDFGRHGEFAVFARGFRGLRVTGVARHSGNVAVAKVKGPGPHSPPELRFGYIDRKWRLLFGTH